MNDSQRDPLELQRHGRFLRSLARSLVSDPAAADDLAQEAALARLTLASRGGSLGDGDARPWFATVLRRGALKHRRSAARREHRETLGARPDQAPSASSLAARMDAAERLLCHLNALEPDLRDALAARYYDAQTFAEASKSLGVPVSTLKSRVDRGLQELRARLDQDESGGREAWLGALSGFALADGRTSAAAMGGGGVSIGALVGAAALAVAACAIGFALRNSAGTTRAQPKGAESLARAPFEASPPSIQPEAALAQPSAEPSTRVPIAPSQEDGALPSTPSGRVWQWNAKGEKKPLAGASVMWTSHLPAKEELETDPPPVLRQIGYGGDSEPTALQPPESVDIGRARTSADGFFSWLEAPKAAEVHVFVAATDQHREYRWSGSQAEWDALPKPIEIVLARHGELGGRVVDLDGAPLMGAKISVVNAGPKGPLTATSDAEGRFRLPGAKRRGRPTVNLNGWILVGSEPPTKRRLGGWDETTLVMARTGALHLELPEGAPHTVWAMTASSNPHSLGWGHLGSIEERVPVDAEGHATIAGLPIGVPLRVYADGGAAYTHHQHGRAVIDPTLASRPFPEGARPIVITDAGTLRLKLEESHYARVTGQTLSATGAPLAGASVVASAEWRMNDGARQEIDRATSDEQGRFALDVHWAGSPRPILIHGSHGPPPTDAGTRPALFAARVLAPQELADCPEVDLNLAVQAKTHGSVTLPSGALDATRIDLVLFGQGGSKNTPVYRRVAGLHAIADDGAFELAETPPGHYRIIASHPNYEAVELYCDLPSKAPISIELTQQRRATVRIAPQLVEVDANPADILWTCFVRPDTQDHPLAWSELDFQANGYAEGRLAPGAYQVSLIGLVGGRRIGCASWTVMDVHSGKETFRLKASPFVRGVGQLARAASEAVPQSRYIALVPEGETEAIYAGPTPGGESTRWLQCDSTGRFRFHCPAGQYTAFSGSLSQLRAGTPSTRTSIRIHSNAPYFRLVD